MLCVGLGKRLAWAKPIPVLQCFSCTEVSVWCCARSRLNLHGLNVCSRKDVISNASFLHDGAYRADWKAVVSAEGSRELQHKAEVLTLEEEPSRMVLSLKPVCCETAAELLRTPAILLALAAHFCFSTWALPTASLWLCCMLCVLGPQVSSLGGSKAMRSFSHWRSLLWDSHIWDPCKAIVKLHSSCQGLSCYCQHAVDQIWPQWNQLQILIDGAGPGSLLVLQVVSQLRKMSPLFFLKR